VNGRGTEPAQDPGLRDEAVLNAVIELHVATAEPVSSAQLCAAYRFDCSPATVRNAMARLETAGYLMHPYTSAGKIPTVKAFRWFVDQLLQHRAWGNGGDAPLPPVWLEQVQAADLILKLTTGVVAAASQLLAVGWVTGQPAERLERIDLVRASSRRVLLVILTRSGAEIQDVIETDGPIPPETLNGITTWVNAHARGRTASELRDLSRAGRSLAERRLGELLRRTLAAVGANLTVPGREAMAVAGASNLIAQPEFNNIGTARRLVSWLDHREALLQSLAAPGLEHHGLRVAIGADPADGLPPLACVTVGLELPEGRHARMGVIGPMRMAYGRVLALLGATAGWVAPAGKREER
jgi:heat-inducible transcriptional repressor